jgi:NitT/TauT family transport system substrate-binding protein
LLFALCSCLAAACGPQPDATDEPAGVAPSGEAPIRLRIADTRFSAILPMYVAEEQGMFEANGLEAEWLDVRDPGHAGKLLAAGKADLVISTFANIVPIEARRPGSLRLLFPASETSADPGSYILVRPDSPIQSLADLGGRRIGTYSGPSQKAYALIVLEELGYREPEDVRLVQVAPSAQVQGLFGGAFDALFTVEPYASVALVNGARPLATGVRTTIISDPFWVGSAAVPAGLAEAQPTLVPRLQRALDSAVRYIGEHEAEAREVIARRIGIDRAVAQRSGLYDWVVYPNAEQLAQIQEAIDLLHQERMIDASVDVFTVFAGSDSD